MKKVFIPLLLILALVGAAVWHHCLFPSNTGTSTLTLHGNVDIREVNLGFRVSGRITEVLHDEGDSIKAGEILARLDPATYQSEVDQARANLSSIEADLQRLTAGYRSEEIAQAKADVGQKEVAASNAKTSADRARSLIITNAITRQQHDDLLAREQETEKQLESSRANFALMQAGYRSEDIAKSRAQVEQARATLSTAEIRLGDTTLSAPSSGTLYTRALEPGAIVQPGSTVLTLSLDRPVWVRAYVDESNLGLVAPGDSVEIFTDSRPGKPYRGKIGFVSPRAEFTPKTVETENLRTSLVYRLRIVIDDPDSLLRQGMPLTIRIAK